MRLVLVARTAVLPVPSWSNCLVFAVVVSSYKYNSSTRICLVVSHRFTGMPQGLVISTIACCAWAGFCMLCVSLGAKRCCYWPGSQIYYCPWFYLRTWYRVYLCCLKITVAYVCTYHHVISCLFYVYSFFFSFAHPIYYLRTPSSLSPSNS